MHELLQIKDVFMTLYVRATVKLETDIQIKELYSLKFFYCSLGPESLRKPYHHLYGSCGIDGIE